MLLQVLRLRGNPLGEEGVGGLAEAIQTGSSLLELDVGSCEVGAHLTATLPPALPALPCKVTRAVHPGQQNRHLAMDWVLEAWTSVLALQQLACPRLLEAAQPHAQTPHTSRAATTRCAMFEHAPARRPQPRHPTHSGVTGACALQMGPAAAQLVACGRQLRKLSLFNSRLGDEGAFKVAELAACQLLLILHLTPFHCPQPCSSTGPEPAC